jgi:hypothetical protein
MSATIYSATCPICKLHRQVGHKRYAKVSVCRSCSTRRNEKVLAKHRTRWEQPARDISLDPRGSSYAAWGWLAGIIDGEGHIATERPAIVVGMTDEATINRCREITGVGSVKRRVIGRKTPLYFWAVYSANARDVAWLCLPFLVTKREAARKLVESV